MKDKERTCMYCKTSFINKGANGGWAYCSEECRRANKSHKYTVKMQLAKATGIIHGRPMHIHIYDRYMKCAIKRGKSFNLSIEDFKNLWQLPCHYCGDKIEFVGIDRIDNSIGYRVDNIVPCCAECNLMKRGMSGAEFIAHCNKITLKFNQKMLFLVKKEGE